MYCVTKGFDRTAMRLRYFLRRLDVFEVFVKVAYQVHLFLE